MISAQEAREGRIGVNWRDDEYLINMFPMIKADALSYIEDKIKLHVYKGQESVRFNMDEILNHGHTWKLHYELMKESVLESVTRELREAGYYVSNSDSGISICWYDYDFNFGKNIPTQWTPSEEELSASACLLNALNERN